MSSVYSHSLCAHPSEVCSHLFCVRIHLQPVARTCIHTAHSSYVWSYYMSAYFIYVCSSYMCAHNARTHTHTHTHTNTHTNTHTLTHTVCAHTDTMCLCVRVCARTRTHLDHSEGGRDGQRESERERERARESEREINDTKTQRLLSLEIQQISIFDRIRTPCPVPCSHTPPAGRCS